MERNWLQQKYYQKTGVKIELWHEDDAIGYALWLEKEIDRLRGCLVKIAESVRSSNDYQEAQHDEYIQVIGVELDIEDAEDLVELLKEGGE